MAKNTIAIEKYGIRFGLIAAVAMFGYFLLINVLNLQNVEVIRFASNIFIIGAVIWAIYSLKTNTQGPVPYLPGLGIGFLVGLIGSVLYAIFIYVYAKFLNPDYAAILETQDYYGSVMSPMMLAGAITILGTAVGTMTGYILMMAFDNSGARTAE
ncbi:DUF4199 domain-containing protein [Adhaeribacter pallidiroseus]|uniref:DUF4199 domain-containing protein n=1 Tax=Adhaeribacter pallidiroseus TaxID=2072847 RepID=A0A369QGB2_9BACT|nr:DUF4199 domain-containing protein [Adhaeribacter pallidiroseus]RDC62266.1 hypothetical protein AHMF7616_00857 [Adhaeribacter pallidiroseus]